MEEQFPISINNLVVNNVNHLKELLINFKIQNQSLQQLNETFQTYKLPNIIFKFIEEKCVAQFEGFPDPSLQYVNP